jgi:multimeric flavodoxin WrbA
MARLLIVHHSPSPTLSEMLGRVVDGANTDGLESVDVRVSAALETSVPDVLEADGYVLGTPANLGYMSGALKHFFDTIYNDCLDVTAGRPYGLYLHGQTDTDGARLAVAKITTGLDWRLAQAPVSSLGPLDDPTREALWELGAAVTATLLP